MTLTWLVITFILIGDGQEDEEVIIGEGVDGNGQPIKLQRVMLEDLDQEVLMDEQGNLYDMEGNYLGKLDEGGEEEPEQKHHEKQKPNPLPEIPPYNPKGKKRSHSP